MNIFFRIALLFIFASLVLPMNVQAQESDTISVPLAIGIGKDGDAALKNALRAAVEQAVGSMVDSEILIENEEVVSDKILSFSDGFVQTYRQLGEPRVMDGGLVSVRISAEVKRNELDAQLRNTGVIKVSVDGRSLAAQAITKEMSREDGIEMLVNMLETFPLNVYDTSTSWRYDIDTRKVVIEVETKINTREYVSFARVFSDLLLKVGTRPLGTVSPNIKLDETRSSSHLARQGIRTSVSLPRLKAPLGPMPQEGNLVISNSWPNFRRAGQEGPFPIHAFAVPKEVYGMIRPLLGKRTMIVEALDNNGRVLSTGKTVAPMPSFDWQSINVVFVFPALNMETNDRRPRAALIAVPEASTIGHGLPEYKLEVPLDISRDDIEQISAVRISVE